MRSILTALGLFASIADSLELGPLRRREIFQQGASALVTAAVAPVSGASASSSSLENQDDDLRKLFRSLYSTKKLGQPAPVKIEWNPPSRDFSKLRYSTSSLSSKDGMIPIPKSGSLPRLPSWLEGHWLITYKFDGVSFPNGRDKISLALPGAGLGTCAVLPNVGANPAPFVQRFGSSSFVWNDDDSSDRAPTGPFNEPFVVEDVAYNLPRKLEGFWPEAKVGSVRVSTSAKSVDMGPACLVTGDGCSFEENPNLHGEHATRCQLEFQGPTRRGGLRMQHMDVSMVDWTTSTASFEGIDEFLMGRSFVQYNQEQELTSYYREYVSYERQLTKQPNGKLKGRTCVASFLPSSNEALALYSYSMKMYAITGEEATMY